MDLMIRGIAVYLFLLLIFRISGKRSLRNATTFDFVMLLIVAETTQQALVGDDSSVTGAFLLIVVLVGTDIVLSLVKRWSPRIDRLLEGQPLVILRNGVPLRRRMRLERVDEEDILSAARETRGLDRMEQIKRAVLERNGAISIVPRREPLRGRSRGLAAPVQVVEQHGPVEAGVRVVVDDGAGTFRWRRGRWCHRLGRHRVTLAATPRPGHESRE